MRIIAWTIFIAAVAVEITSSAFAQPTGRGPFECIEPYYRMRQCEPMRPASWMKVSAANGQEAYVDTASIKYRQDLVPPYTDETGRRGKVARALIHFEDGAPINASNAGWFDYDCDGPYLIGQAGVLSTGPAQYLPRQSFGFQIRSVVCGSSGMPVSSRASTSEMNVEGALKEVEQILKDPEKVKRIECLGIEVFKNPKPSGHPPSQQECAALTRTRPQ